MQAIPVHVMFAEKKLNIYVTTSNQTLLYEVQLDMCCRYKLCVHSSIVFMFIFLVAVFVFLVVPQLGK